MFNLSKEHAIGTEDQCNEEFVKQSLWQNMTTPFIGSEDCPELDIDSILEEVTKSMRDIAMNL
jgi:hypothetical protein